MSHSRDEIVALSAVCDALAQGDRDHAASLARSGLPFSLFERDTEKYNEFQSMKIFLRDGFIDRYTGQRLVFPGTLRLLSQLLPDEFPFHSNWKMTECHYMYWKYFPTIDHIDPRTRGGGVNDNNLITTSMLRNSAKSNWTLEELAWRIYPPGNVADWDGLTKWFLSYTERNPIGLANLYLRQWQGAAIRALTAC